MTEAELKEIEAAVERTSIKDFSSLKFIISKQLVAAIAEKDEYILELRKILEEHPQWNALENEHLLWMGRVFKALHRWK